MIFINSNITEIYLFFYLQVNNSLQHPEQNFYLHSDKIEHIEHNLDYRNSDCRNLKKQLESPKLEDCNSDNSLLIDEQLIQNGDKEVYLVNDELTSVYKEETSFEVSYESQFYKCETCFDVFPNEELLNVHNVESHVNLENKVSELMVFCYLEPIVNVYKCVTDCLTSFSLQDFLIFLYCFLTFMVLS